MKSTLKRTISSVLALSMIVSAVPMMSNSSSVSAETITTTIPNQTVTAITTDRNPDEQKIIATEATIVEDCFTHCGSINAGVATNLNEMPTDQTPIRLDMGGSEIFDDYVVVYVVYSTTHSDAKFVNLTERSANEWCITMEDRYSSAPDAGTAYDVFYRYAVGIKIPKALYNGQNITLYVNSIDEYRPSTGIPVTSYTTTEAPNPNTTPSSVTQVTSMPTTGVPNTDTTTPDPYPVTGTTTMGTHSGTIETTPDPYPVTGTTTIGTHSGTIETTPDPYPVTGTTTIGTHSGTIETTPDPYPVTGTTTMGTHSGTIETTPDPYPVTGTTTIGTHSGTMVTTTEGEYPVTTTAPSITSIVSQPPVTTTTPTTVTGIMGDINSDGKLNVIDLMMMAKISIGIETLTQSMIKNGDVTGDGKINVSDMIYVAKQLVKGNTQTDKDITDKTYDISQFSLSTINGSGLELENNQKLDTIKSIEELNAYKTWVGENYPHEEGTGLDKFLNGLDESSFADSTLFMFTYYIPTPSDYIFKFDSITKNTDSSLNLNLKAGSESETSLPSAVNVPRFVAMLIPNSDLNSKTITSVTLQSLYGELQDYDTSNYVTNVWRTEDKNYTFTSDYEILIIESSDVLQGFIGSIENKDDMSFLMPSSDDTLVGFDTLFEKYDDTFFTNNNLIICSTPTQKGRYIKTSIQCNSNTMNIENIIDCMPTAVGDGSLTTQLDYYNNIILEMPKVDMEKVKTVNILNMYAQ